MAKQRRIGVHPDRLKSQKGLSARELARIDVVAKEVGEAALLLSDVKERAKYDERVTI